MRDHDWVCLMYHDIAPTAVALGGGRQWFAVTPESFARHLDLIRESGFAGCSISQALEQPSRRVGISFDDGVRSDYERAFPALAERSMTATFFVVTDLVGSLGHVTWPELREMHAGGMSIQSHTRTHPFLSELTKPVLRDELMGSKSRLDDELGQDTDQLALPGGDAPRRGLRHLLAETGYRIVATSRSGPNRQSVAPVPRFIRRCTMAGDVGDVCFRRVLDADLAARLHRQLRELVLGTIRGTLGPSRYARWRRRFLDGRSVSARRRW